MKLIALSLAVLMSFVSAAAAQPCMPADGRSAVMLSREIAGARDFREYLDGPGWTFALTHAPHGWDIRLYDDENLDLTQMTPPLRGSVNHRQVYGWHFRNAGNTGPNQGDVNAPQALRLFGFDPALSGTGGFKPSSEAGAAPEDQPGRGALTIRDYGLADLEPGEKARMVYMKFDVCMSWPMTDRERNKKADDAAALEASRTVSPELLEMMGGCGLALGDYEINAFVAPVELGGDFDGDGAHDQAVPIIRKADAKRGIAICRAGTWIHLLGMDGEKIGENLDPAYFNSIDWWSLHWKGPVGESVEQGAPPTLGGDGIVVGKEGASSVLIYWNGDAFTSYWQGD